jgi:hypothetical protein
VNLSAKQRDHYGSGHPRPLSKAVNPTRQLHLCRHHQIFGARTTKEDGPFEALCRLYGPKKLFFDKTWKLPDIQGRADEPVTTIATLEGGGHQGVTHHPLDEPL